MYLGKKLRNKSAHQDMSNIAKSSCHRVYPLMWWQQPWNGWNWQMSRPQSTFPRYVFWSCVALFDTISRPGEAGPRSRWSCWNLWKDRWMQKTYYAMCHIVHHQTRRHSCPAFYRTRQSMCGCRCCGLVPLCFWACWHHPQIIGMAGDTNWRTNKSQKLW